MRCVFLVLFSWHTIAWVFLMNVQKGLIQINWELGERDVAILMKVSKTKFWSHITQQQMRSRTSNTHRCNRHEQSFGGGKRIGSIRTSLHLQNREKHPKFQHFWIRQSRHVPSITSIFTSQMWWISKFEVIRGEQDCQILWQHFHRNARALRGIRTFQKRMREVSLRCHLHRTAGQGSACTTFSACCRQM